MKKVAWILASGALIAACGGGRSMTDAGNDTGGIVLMDAGMGRDAFTASMPDARMASGTCGSIASAMMVWPALPMGCLPRCSAATLDAVRMCGAMDDACFDAALMADRTAAANLDVGMGMTLAVDCGGNGDNFPCLTWQNLSCIGDSCPMELSDYITCANGVMDPMMIETVCASQITALNSCQTANMTALQTCGQSRVLACFDGGGGFLPGSAQRASLPAFDVRSLTAAQVRGLASILAD